jgi:SAM-dependent methyltransferase
MEQRQLLDEQIAYYRARAAEYDEWFFRQGRYDRGPEQRATWFQEVGQLEAALQTAAPQGEVLELACGTGLWTRHLVANAAHITALDASSEAIALNQARLRSDKLNYVVGDVFAWTPPRTFDFVFFAFWLSHVPDSLFDSFWDLMRRALKPNGRAFFIDSLREPQSTARDHAAPDDSGVVRRRLNDGREFNVIKVFHDPSALEQRLRRQGWEGAVRSSGRFFLYGSLARCGEVVGARGE